MSRGYSAIGLVAPKCNANVGGALRAAGCYGAALIAIQGARYQKQKADTLKAWRHVPMIHAESIFDVIPYDCIPVAIEIIDGARELPNFIHPERAFYIFGPEDGSLGRETTDRCKHVIAIPTRFCMNLAATVNVVLYDRLVKNNVARVNP
jgi:tRNA(Leu) C34 or U34 (ribose-2'-O)-methylase TrmL